MLKFQDLNVCSYDFQVAITEVLHLLFAQAAQDPNTNVPAHLTEILTEFLFKKKPPKASTKTYWCAYDILQIKSHKQTHVYRIIPYFFRNYIIPLKLHSSCRVKLLSTLPVPLVMLFSASKLLCTCSSDHQESHPNKRMSWLNWGSKMDEWKSETMTSHPWMHAWNNEWGLWMGWRNEGMNRKRPARNEWTNKRKPWDSRSMNNQHTTSQCKVSLSLSLLEMPVMWNQKHSDI